MQTHLDIKYPWNGMPPGKLMPLVEPGGTQYGSKEYYGYPGKRAPGAIGLDNDPVTDEIIFGQYLCGSFRGREWGRTKSVYLTLDGGWVWEDSTGLSAFNLWLDTQSLATSRNLYEGVPVAICILDCMGDELFAYREYKLSLDHPYRYVIYYRNKYGAIDTLPIKGKISVPSSPVSGRVDDCPVSLVTMETGWITRERCPRMDHLLNSPEIWLHDLHKKQVTEATLCRSNMTFNGMSANNYSLTLAVGIKQNLETEEG